MTMQDGQQETPAGKIPFSRRVRDRSRFQQERYSGALKGLAGVMAEGAHEWPRRYPIPCLLRASWSATPRASG